MLKLCQCGYFRSKNVFSENVTPLREVELFEMEIIQVGTGFSYIDGISYPHIPNRLILANPGNQRFTIGTFEARFVKFSCADPHVLQLLQALPPTTILSDGRLKALMADIAHGEETPGAARYFAQQSALCALIAEAAAQLQQEPLTAPSQEILSADLLAAKEYIDPETVNDPVTYPDESKLANGSSYAYLPEEITRYVEELFMEVRNG